MFEFCDYDLLVEVKVVFVNLVDIKIWCGGDILGG